MVHPSVPATTIPEFIAYAKANPGKINYGSAGPGTPQNIACELFKMMAGVNLVHVPYRGGAPAVTDLIGGQIQVIFCSAVGIDRADQGRPAARPGGNDRGPVERVAGRSDGGRLRARL